MLRVNVPLKKKEVMIWKQSKFLQYTFLSLNNIL